MYRDAPKRSTDGTCENVSVMTRARVQHVAMYCCDEKPVDVNAVNWKHSRNYSRLPWGMLQEGVTQWPRMYRVVSERLLLENALVEHA